MRALKFQTSEARAFNKVLLHDIKNQEGLSKPELWERTLNFARTPKVCFDDALLILSSLIHHTPGSPDIPTEHEESELVLRADARWMAEKADYLQVAIGKGASPEIGQLAVDYYALALGRALHQQDYFMRSYGRHQLLKQFVEGRGKTVLTPDELNHLSDFVNTRIFT